MIRMIWFRIKTSGAPGCFLSDKRQVLVDEPKHKNTVWNGEGSVACMNKKMEEGQCSEVLYTRPYISLIIPVYNSERYLARCIESIINQTYQNIEIILVDDGSLDNSLNICKKYQKADSRISVISQENQGPNVARKAGLLISKGDLIGFADSDDWLEPDTYEEMVQVYEKYHPELISAGIFRDYEDTGIQDEFFDNYAEGLYRNLEHDIYPTMLRDYEAKDFGLYCTLVNKLFLRDKLLKVYENINTDIFFGEDCLALYSYCLLADSVYVIRKSYYHYNIRQGSICRNANENLPYNAYLLYKELKKLFMRYSCPAVLMRQLKRYILNVEEHYLKILFDINLEVWGKWKFHYENYYDSRIVIYGAGLCGQALHHQLCNNYKKDIIVAWIDEKYVEKTEQSLYHVDPPEKLMELQYDYIIIAVLDQVLAEKIRKELIDKYRIKDEVILWKEAWHEPFFEEVF